MIVTFWWAGMPIHRFVNQLEELDVQPGDYVWVRMEKKFFKVRERWQTPASHEWPGWHLLCEPSDKLPPWEHPSPPGQP